MVILLRVLRNSSRLSRKGLSLCCLSQASAILQQSFDSVSVPWNPSQAKQSLAFHQSAALKSTLNKHESDKKDVLYKGKFMRIFRVLVRAKIFQLSGVAVFATALATFLTEGGVSLRTGSVAMALIVGCAVSATTLNFYSRRYIGELAMLKRGTEPLVCFSVMDFWGHREDNLVPLSSVVPPLQGLSPESLVEMAQQPLIPVQVEDDRQYYISLRHGTISNKETLMKIMKGDTEAQKRFAR